MRIPYRIMLLALILGFLPFLVPTSEASPEKSREGYPPIVLYSVEWCPHCKAAKKYLTERNIPFVNRDVEKDPEAMEELKERYGARGVPVIVIGNDLHVLRGFAEEKLEKALREAERGK